MGGGGWTGGGPRSVARRPWPPPDKVKGLAAPPTSSVSVRDHHHRRRHHQHHHPPPAPIDSPCPGTADRLPDQTSRSQAPLPSPTPFIVCVPAAGLVHRKLGTPSISLLCHSCFPFCYSGDIGTESRYL